MQGSPPGSVVNNPPAGQETQEVRIRSLENPLQEEMSTHSSTLSRKSCGQRSLVGYSSWIAESDTTEHKWVYVFESIIMPTHFCLCLSRKLSSQSSSDQHHSILSGFLSVFVLPFSDSEKPAPWFLVVPLCITNHSPVATTASSTPWVASSPHWGSSTLLGASSVQHTVPSLLSSSSIPSQAIPTIPGWTPPSSLRSDFITSCQLPLPSNGVFLSPPVASTP